MKTLTYKGRAFVQRSGPVFCKCKYNVIVTLTKRGKNRERGRGGREAGRGVKSFHMWLNTHIWKAEVRQGETNRGGERQEERGGEGRIGQKRREDRRPPGESGVNSHKGIKIKLHSLDLELNSEPDLTSPDD